MFIVCEASFPCGISVYQHRGLSSMAAMADLQAFLLITLLTWAAVSVSGTAPELSTTTGDTVNIPCLFGEGTLRNTLIEWYYNDKTRMILKSVNRNFNIGAEYKNRASLQDDYSTLILTEIRVADEGTYHCVVDTLKQPIVSNIKTKLNVFSLRPDTLPEISPCTGIDESSSCSIRADQSLTLTCTLPHVFPVEDTKLIWYHDRKHFSSIHDVTQNDDGTTDISEHIQVSETGNFTCNATYRSANGRENTAVSVEAWIIPPTDVPNTPVKNMTSGQIAGIIIGIIGISLAIYNIFLYLWKARGQRSTRKEKNESDGTQLCQVISAEELPLLETSNENGIEVENVDYSTLPSSSTVRNRNRMSSMVNVDFDGILHKIAKALFNDTDIEDLGVALGLHHSDIRRYIDVNARHRGNYWGTLDMLRTWQKGQTTLAEKAELRSALLRARFVNLADEYLGSSNPGQQQGTATGPSSAAMSAPTSTSRREITDEAIYNLSRLLPEGKYGRLGGVLGFPYNYVEQILKKRSNDFRAAFVELLQEWKNKGRSMEDLDAALMKADLGELVSKYMN